VVFAIVMTLFSGLLFKEVLNLPIPYDPVGIVPAPVTAVYADIKSALGQGVGIIKSLFVR
jgi:hypothetical protein